MVNFLNVYCFDCWNLNSKKYQLQLKGETKKKIKGRERIKNKKNYYSFNTMRRKGLKITTKQKVNTKGTKYKLINKLVYQILDTN